MPSASSLHPDLSDAMHETLVMLRAQVNDKDLSPAERRLAGNSIIRLVAVAGRFQGGTGLGGTGLGGTGLQTGVRNSSRRRRTHSDNDDRSYHRDASPSSASSSAPSSPLTNPDFAYEPGPRISSPSGLDTLNDERAPVAATTDPTSSSLNPPSPIAGGTLGGGG
ncbi:MAG: hypothetical protein H7Y88_04800, partial [Phycisphaerales bacterium]|nr:hypothetical protein [Phycisphaerales bacterium]